MVRTQIYLTEEEKNSLESTALSQGVSQSDLIRRAIDEMLAKTSVVNKGAILDEIAGIWSQRNDIPDIREMRTGWRNRSSR